MPRMTLQFTGFDEVMKKLKQANGDIRKTTEQALKETHKIVTAKAKKAVAPHRETGETESSLRESPEINWNGDIATVHVGFDIRNGGLPSIFLMYGTPKMQKDQKLYNAFFGSAVKREILEAQEDVFLTELHRLWGVE